MSSLHRARSAFIADATRTRHMLAVSAVILGATFMPLFGGPLTAGEVQALQTVLTGATDSAAPPAAAATPEASSERRSRLQSASLHTASEAEFVNLALPNEAELEPALLSEEEVETAETMNRIEPLLDLDPPSVALEPPDDLAEPVELKSEEPLPLV